MPAVGSDRPFLVPSHDTAVTYRVVTTTEDGEAHPGETRASWSVAAGVMRVDLPPASFGEAGYVLVNSDRAMLVLPPYRAVQELPDRGGGISPLAVLGTAARFTRVGSGTVGGQACEEWTYVTQFVGTRINGSLCVAADHTVLRLADDRGGRDGLRGASLEASAISEVAQDGSRFRIPAGFHVAVLTAAEHAAANAPPP